MKKHFKNYYSFPSILIDTIRVLRMSMYNFDNIYYPSINIIIKIYEIYIMKQNQHLLTGICHYIVELDYVNSAYCEFVVGNN